MYLRSVVLPSARVTFWSQVFAADAIPPALVVSFISDVSAFIPYSVLVKKSLIIKAGFDLCKSLLATALVLGSNTFLPFTLNDVAGIPPPNFSVSNIISI